MTMNKDELRKLRFRLQKLALEFEERETLKICEIPEFLLLEASNLARDMQRLVYTKDK